MLANVVVNQAGATRVEGHEPLANAGGSLRDMTRIAGANPRMWIDVFLDNADAVRAGLAEHRRRIEEVEAALERRDARLHRRAGSARRRPTDAACSQAAYGDAGALQRVQVHVADRPNVLAEIMQAFGAARIDIRDFELDHISPEQGGTLTLLVSGEDEAHRAEALLESQGYGVVVSAGRRMKIEPAARIDGHIAVPGDKSVSHRALLIGALTEGETRVSNWGRSGDTESTLGVVRALGVHGRRGGRRHARRHTASASAGSAPPDAPLDCGNAGTLVRLVAGILAFQDGRFELDRRRVALAPPDGARSSTR